MIISFCVALMAVVFAGWWAARGSFAADEDYYLAGRAYGPTVIGLSAAAAGNSGFLMIGSVGLGYAAGLSGIALPLGVLLGDWIYWTYLARRVHEATPQNTNTVPERLAQRVPPDGQNLVRRVASVILLLCLGTYAAAQVHALGISIERAFGMDIRMAVTVYVLVICSYTVVGGFRSSVLASLIHAGIVLLTAMIVLVAIGLTISENPTETVGNAIRAAAAGPGGTDAAGFLLQTLGYAAFGVAAGLGLPTVLVKVFALRDARGIGRAKWTYIGYTQWVFCTMLFLGILLHVLVPDIANPELGLFEFSSVFIHPILTGLVLAGILAAISSTFEALLVILSSAVGSDILGHKLERLGDRSAHGFHVLITALVGITVAIIALTTSATVFHLVIYSVSSLISAFGPAMIITTFNWRTSPRALVATMLSGFAVSVIWIGAGIDATINSVLPSFAAALAVHRLVPKPSDMQVTR